MPLKNNPLLVVLATSLFVMFFTLVTLNFVIRGEQQHAYISQSFLSGSLSFVEMPGSWHDAVFFSGKYYWPEGPFPSLALLPFAYLFNYFGLFFYQGYMQMVLVVCVFLTVYSIAKHLKYGKEDALFWAYAFTASSAFIGVALVPWVWYFSQVITVLVVLLIIREFITKRRLFLVGILAGILVLTRIPASFIILLFVLEILYEKSPHWKNKLKALFKLAFPYSIAVLFLFLYNYARFGNIFEQGYLLANVPDFQKESIAKYGMFSLTHVPGNLYYFLIATPLPIFKDTITHVLSYPFLRSDPWGMSVFITSPYIVYLFFLRYKDHFYKFVIPTVVCIALPVFLYYGIGFRQFGYRYALDFFPLIFLLLLVGYKKTFGSMTSPLKVLIICSSFLNLYLFTTIF